MERKLLQTAVSMVLCVGLLLACPVLAGAGASKPGRTIDPIVSTEWLAANSNSPKLVILDVRSPDEYKAGHIPGSISAPFGFPKSAWITVRNKLFLEVPDTAELFKTIGSLGIQADSRVVVISAPTPQAPAPYYGLANATRVIDTLIYAGVPNVAFMDGGYPKWTFEKRAVNTKAVTPKPVSFKGALKADMFVSLEYVHKNLDSANLIDARNSVVYYGAMVEPWTPKAGHIPGASSLPGPWIWDTSKKGGFYTFKDQKTLAAMTAGVLGDPKAQAIVYCGVGGYASSWWFVLTQVLGYQDVKFFDGAAQEWGMHYDMLPYRWE
jgi:thiosulfate/3-mercaptopyruvate sulfurtransferase